MKRVMSVATSDSGAGIQADLEAFLQCGIYGTTAIVAASRPHGGLRPLQHTRRDHWLCRPQGPAENGLPGMRVWTAGVECLIFRA